MMVDPFKNFADISTEEWKNKIASFLKGASLDTLQVALGNDIILDPVVRKKHLSSPEIAPSFSSDNQWLMGEKILVGHDIGSTKANVMSALEYGVNYLHLHFEYLCNPDEFNRLLDGIYLNMIHVHFSGEITNDHVEYLTEISQSYDEPISLSFDATIEINTSQFNTKHRCITRTLSLEEQSINGLATLLTLCNKHIEKSLSKEHQPLNEILIHIKLSDSFYLNIAMVKALKRLWLALLEGHKQTTYQMPFFVVSTQNTTDDMFQQMIANTSQAIAAIVEGVDAVLVRTENTTDPNIARRIGRNIHHILREESYLAQIVGATSGAYLLEDLSQQIIEKTWQQFCTSHS